MTLPLPPPAVARQRDKKKFFLEKIFVCVFFFIYFLASQFFLPYVKKADIYPFFRWSLFDDCHPNDRMPEIEISFVGLDGKRNTITNKIFTNKRHSKLHSKLHHLMLIMFRARDRNNKMAEATALKILLRKISYYLHVSTFEYKIFRSELNLVEYTKRNSLKKEFLFREGQFKK